MANYINLGASCANFVYEPPGVLNNILLIDNQKVLGKFIPSSAGGTLLTDKTSNAYYDVADKINAHSSGIPFVNSADYAFTISYNTELSEVGSSRGLWRILTLDNGPNVNTLFSESTPKAPIINIVNSNTQDVDIPFFPSNSLYNTIYRNANSGSASTTAGNMQNSVWASKGAYRVLSNRFAMMCSATAAEWAKSISITDKDFTISTPADFNNVNKPPSSSRGSSIKAVKLGTAVDTVVNSDALLALSALINIPYKNGTTTPIVAGGTTPDIIYLKFKKDNAAISQVYLTIEEDATNKKLVFKTVNLNTNRGYDTNKLPAFCLQIKTSPSDGKKAVLTLQFHPSTTENAKLISMAKSVFGGTNISSSPFYNKTDSQILTDLSNDLFNSYINDPVNNNSIKINYIGTRTTTQDELTNYIAVITNTTPTTYFNFTTTTAVSSSSSITSLMFNSAYVINNQVVLEGSVNTSSRIEYILEQRTARPPVGQFDPTLANISGAIMLSTRVVKGEQYYLYWNGANDISSTSPTSAAVPTSIVFSLKDYWQDNLTTNNVKHGLQFYFGDMTPDVTSTSSEYYRWYLHYNKNLYNDANALTNVYVYNNTLLVGQLNSAITSSGAEGWALQTLGTTPSVTTYLQPSPYDKALVYVRSEKPIAYLYPKDKNTIELKIIQNPTASQTAWSVLESYAVNPTSAQFPNPYVWKCTNCTPTNSGTCSPTPTTAFTGS